MAAPAPQQTAAGHDTGESAMLIPNAAPPAYNEKDPLRKGRAPVQQQGGQLPQAQYPQVQLGGMLPSQTWPAQAPNYPMPQVARQMPAMIAAPPPDHPVPHDFLMPALVTTIICGILNVVSMAFGIPAIIFAVMSINTRNNKNYPQARQYGRNALILTVLNIVFSLCLALLIIGMIVGLACASPDNYYYDGYYSGSC